MRAAILQMQAGIDPLANADIVTRAIGEAKAGRADILFTPEMSNFLDSNRARAAGKIVREDEDVFLMRCREVAKDASLPTLIGSIAIKGDEPDSKWRNRSILIGPDGEIQARYDKMHLFDVDLDTGESWRESAVYDAGDRPVLVDQLWGKIGLSICYDLRFSGLYQSLSNAGADLLTVPAAFTVPTGVAHWHVLLRARAIEASCFVVAAAQSGEHQDGRTTFGHSLIVDPWGKVLLDMGDQKGLGFADLDMDQINDVRARVPSLDNRREIGNVLHL